MEWTEEERRELSRAKHAAMGRGANVEEIEQAIASRAVELAAARGGTAPEFPEGFDDVLSDMETCGTKTEAQCAVTVRGLVQRDRSMRARVAALEAERDAAVKQAAGYASRCSTLGAERDAALMRIEEAEERCRILTEAGQRLSAAVDKHVGAPLTDAEIGRNALGLSTSCACFTCTTPGVCNCGNADCGGCYPS